MSLSTCQLLTAISVKNCEKYKKYLTLKYINHVQKYKFKRQFFYFF